MPLRRRMANMFRMFKAMAVRAKNFQIGNLIVRSVPIFVVNTQNFWMRIKPTSITFCNSSPSKKIFSCRRERRIPYFFLRFPNTSPRAIFSRFTWRAFKVFIAMSARIIDRSFEMLGFVITTPRTILSFVASRTDMRELIQTYFTFSRYLNSCSFSFTRSRAIFGCFKPVFRYIKFFCTKCASDIFTRERFSHAVG